MDNEKDKSLALKFTPSDNDDDDGLDMAYLTRRFCKIVTRNNGFMKSVTLVNPQTMLSYVMGMENPDITSDCPHGKTEHKDITKSGNDRCKDQVIEKFY